MVWCAVLVQLLLGVVWALLQPTYQGLDEPAHVAGVLHLYEHVSWPAPGQLPIPWSEVHTYPDAGFPGVGPRVGEPPRPRGDRLSFAAHRAPSGDSALRSQMSQHPPLFYAAAALGLHLIPGVLHWPYDRLIGLLRFLDALLLAPLPLLCWSAVRRVAADEHLAVAGAFVPLLLPGIARIGGSVSNDPLEIVLTVAFTVCVARIVTGDLTRRTAAAAGALAGLDLLTKGTALVTPAWLVLAYASAWRRHRRATGAPPDMGALLQVAVPPVAVGLAWWVRNLAVFGTVQPDGMSHPPLHRGTHAIGFITRFATDMSFRFWGSLGLPEPPALDRTLCQVATVVVLALALIGAVTRRGRTLGVLLFGFVAVLAVVAYGAFDYYRRYDAYAGVQGRYLYPAVLSLAVLPLLGLRTLLGERGGRWCPPVVLTFAGLLQVAAINASLRTVWAPSPGGPLRGAFHRILQWSPWPRTVTECCWAALCAAALVLVGLTAAAATRPPTGNLRAISASGQ